MILTKLWLRSASATRMMHALFFVRGVEEGLLIFLVTFKWVLSTMRVIDEYFVLIPPVAMLHLSHMMILESIANVSREHSFSLRLILLRAKEMVWRCCSSNTTLHMQLHVLQL